MQVLLSDNIYVCGTVNISRKYRLIFIPDKKVNIGGSNSFSSNVGSFYLVYKAKGRSDFFNIVPKGTYGLQ